MLESPTTTPLRRSDGQLTAEEKDLVKRLTAEGLTDKDIIRRLGMPASTYYRRLKKSGLAAGRVIRDSQPANDSVTSAYRSPA